MELQNNGPTRRQLLGGLLGASATPQVLRSQSKAKPPNVVFIMCDQMRGDALSFMGSTMARTPNLDKLAKRGISFDNYFSNNPVCTPARKSIFSGRYPHEHGSLTNRHGDMLPLKGTMIDYFKARGGTMEGEYIVLAGTPVQFLPPASVLVEEALREAVEKDIEGTPVRVFSAEHLAAIALETNRGKDKSRLIQFIEEEAIEMLRFQQIVERHGLVERWNKFKLQFLADES